jgi:hypothetical protein
MSATELTIASVKPDMAPVGDGGRVLCHERDRRLHHAGATAWRRGSHPIPAS